MVTWIPTHIANSNSQSIAHTDDTDLRDRVLLEELGHKVLTVSDRQ